MLRQPRVSSSRPDSSGPTVNPMPPTVTQAATARARPAGSVYMRVIRVSGAGASSAAPAPCSARAGMSRATWPARLHRTDAAPKTASPAR